MKLPHKGLISMGARCGGGGGPGGGGVALVKRGEQRAGVVSRGLNGGGGQTGGGLW